MAQKIGKAWLSFILLVLAGVFVAPAAAQTVRLLYDSAAEHNAHSDATDLVEAAGIAFLSVWSYELGEEIWRSDGTPEGSA